jgi:hypothetical protein
LLVIEIETEVAFGVKFPYGLWPCVREFARLDDIWEHVDRKPIFVLRCRGGGKMGPRRRGGPWVVSTAVMMVNRRKAWMMVEVCIMVV